MMAEAQVTARSSIMDQIHVKTKELYMLAQDLPRHEYNILLYTLQEFFSALVAMCSHERYWVMQYVLLDKSTKTESSFGNLSDMLTSENSDHQASVTDGLATIKTEKKEPDIDQHEDKAEFPTFMNTNITEKSKVPRNRRKSPARKRASKKSESSSLDDSKDEDVRKIELEGWNHDAVEEGDTDGDVVNDDTDLEDTKDADFDETNLGFSSDDNDSDTEYKPQLEDGLIYVPQRKSRRKSTPRKAVTPKVKQKRGPKGPRGRPKKKPLHIEDSDSESDMLPGGEKIDDDAVIFYCFLCGNPEVKYNKRDLTIHCTMNHVTERNGKKGLPCNTCDKVFAMPKGNSNKGNFSMLLACLNHMVSKHTCPIPDFVAVYKCSQCSFMTLLRMILKRHHERHEELNRFYQCDSCGKMMKKASLKNHNRLCSRVMAQLPNERQEYPCQFCEQVYKTKGSLIIHVGRIHEKKELHLCSSCPASFYAKADLERHMYSQHKVNISKRQISHCPICNFETLEGSLLNKHMKNHEFGTFPCDICGKVFGTENRLKSHRMTHTAAKKHHCPHCDYITHRRYHMERHLAVRHCGSQWRCEQCSFTTFTETNLHKHIDRVHEGKAKAITSVKAQHKTLDDNKIRQHLSLSLDHRMTPSIATEISVMPPELRASVLQSDLQPPSLSSESRAPSLPSELRTSPDHLDNSPYTPPSHPHNVTPQPSQSVHAQPQQPPPHSQQHAQPSAFDPNLAVHYDPTSRPYQPHPSFLEQAFNLQVQNSAHQGDNASIMHVYGM